MVAVTSGRFSVLASALVWVGVSACAILTQVAWHQQREVLAMDKDTLAKRVEPYGQGLAAMIREPQSTTQKRGTPFFKHGTIYIVTYPGKSDPRTLVIGCADPDFTNFLANQPAEFANLANHAGVDLSTPGLRLDYVVTFLETTRDFKTPFRLISRFEDLKPPNAPRPEHLAEYDRLKAKYDNVILPPKLSGEGPWKFTGFAQRGASLVEISATLHADGRVEAADKVLETGEVIAYSR